MQTCWVFCACLVSIKHIASTAEAKRITKTLGKNKSTPPKLYFQQGAYGEELEDLVKGIVTQILGDINCLAIINDKVQQDVFGRVFFKTLTGIPYYKILVEEKEDLQSPNYHTLSVIQHMKTTGCKLYIILISNGGKVSRFLRFGDRYRILDARAKYIILHDHRLFHSSLHYLWKKFVNIVFIRQHGKHHLPGAFARKPIATWYDISTVPFPSPIRKVFIPYRLDTWHQNRFQMGRDLFKDKTSDLRGQEISVVTFHHLPGSVKLPYNMVKKDMVVENTGNEDYGVGGLEVEILRTLSAVMNFKPRLYEAENADLEKWGSKLLNGSYSGLLGEVVAGRADAALGNLHYIPYYLELMDLTVPYVTMCLTFLTPEALTSNSWMTLILPFKPVMWAAVLVAMAMIGFVFYGLANYHHYLLTSHLKTPKHKIIMVQEKNKKVKFETVRELSPTPQSPEGLYLFSELGNGILYTYGMLLMVSLPKLPTGWSLRVLTGWWWLYCILLVVSYRASMTAILANPAPRITIDTMEQLADAKITCGGWGEEVKDFFLSSLDPAGQKIGEKFEVLHDTDKAVERVASGEFAYYENIYYLNYLRIKRQIKVDDEQKKNSSDSDKMLGIKELKDQKNLHIMHDCVIHMPISLGLQKNSPLKPHMDKYLRRIIEAGLIKKWLNDAIERIQSEEINEEQGGSKALMNLEKLYGGIVALGVGYFVSICTLLGEIIHWEFIVKKSPMYDKYNIKQYYKYIKSIKKWNIFKK